LEEKLYEVGRKLGFTLQQLKNLQWLVVGPFKEVKLEDTKSQWEPPKGLGKKIEKKWREHLKMRPNDFPGPMASVSSITIEEDRLIIKFRRTTYKEFIGTRRKSTQRLILTKEPLDKNIALPFSVGAVTVTEDNKIVLEIRGKVGLGEGLLNTLPSGWFDPTQDLTWRDCLLRELKEETGVDEREVIEVKILGLVFDCKLTQQPLLAVTLRISRISKEIIQPRGLKEIARLIFIENEIEKIKDIKYQFTPHAKGTLVLHFALSS